MTDYTRIHLVQDKPFSVLYSCLATGAGGWGALNISNLDGGGGLLMITHACHICSYQSLRIDLVSKQCRVFAGEPVVHNEAGYHPLLHCYAIPISHILIGHLA